MSLLEVGTAEWMNYIIDGARQLGITVTPFQAEQFTVHALELQKWNKKVNLTTLTEPSAVAVKHYLDSIAAAPLITDGCALLDLGSGGGFPGIPLKIMNPSLSITLLDAKRKKVNFLKHTIRVLDLDKAKAQHARVEALIGMIQFNKAFDIVVCRAYSELKQFVRQAMPLLKADGMLIAYKGREGGLEMESLSSGLGAGSPFRGECVSYRLPHFNIKRTLVILRRRPTT